MARKSLNLARGEPTVSFRRLDSDIQIHLPGDENSESCSATEAVLDLEQVQSKDSQPLPQETADPQNSEEPVIGPSKQEGQDPQTGQTEEDTGNDVLLDS